MFSHVHWHVQCTITVLDASALQYPYSPVSGDAIANGFVGQPTDDVSPEIEGPGVEETGDKRQWRRVRVPLGRR